MTDFVHPTKAWLSLILYTLKWLAFLDEISGKKNLKNMILGRHRRNVSTSNEVYTLYTSQIG